MSHNSSIDRQCPILHLAWFTELLPDNSLWVSCKMFLQNNKEAIIFYGEGWAICLWSVFANFSAPPPSMPSPCRCGENLKIPLWNCNSITIIQQHLNIMRSTLIQIADIQLCKTWHDLARAHYRVPPKPKDPHRGGFEGGGGWNGPTDHLSQSNGKTWSPALVMMNALAIHLPPVAMRQ